MRLTAFAIAAALTAGSAAASICHQVADMGPRIVPASLSVGEGEVGITFLGHASFRIQSPGGAEAVTDFAGWWGPGGAPDVVTMNKAHSSHWTPNPPEEIDHVLRGWNPEGGEAMHYLQVADMLVRNVPTDIRSWGGEVEAFGNSIFVFEVADLCIAHLGHLHHKPTELHYGLLGRMDIVMAPVDGGYTMNQEAMIEVMNRLRARVVIPMHWFGRSNLDRFLEGMAGSFDIRHAEARGVTLSRDALPARPTVLVLQGG
jgi:L-ascorbate metabolism protein UlaG (beta-lactamase superfamily)